MFVGREKEAAELRAAHDSHRWVTVVGVPGIGKSALARAVFPELVRIDLSNRTDLPMLPGAAVLLDDGDGCADALATLEHDFPVVLTARRPVDRRDEKVVRVGGLDACAALMAAELERLGGDAVEVGLLERLADAVEHHPGAALELVGLVDLGGAEAVLGRLESEALDPLRTWAEHAWEGLDAVLRDAVQRLSPAVTASMELATALGVDLEALQGLRRRALLERSGGRVVLWSPLLRRARQTMEPEHVEAFVAAMSEETDVEAMVGNLDNHLQCLTHVREMGDETRIDGAMTRLDSVLRRLGQAPRWQALLDEVIAAHGETPARLLARGTLRMRLGMLDGALDDLESAVGELDGIEAASAWYRVGLCRRRLCAFQEAELALGKALERWTALGDSLGVARARISLAGVGVMTDKPGTRDALSRAAEYARSIGFGQGESIVQAALGSLSLCERQYAEAVQHFRLAVELSQSEEARIRLGPGAGLAQVLAGMDGSAAFLHETRALAAASEMPYSEALCWMYLAIGERNLDHLQPAGALAARFDFGDVREQIPVVRAWLAGEPIPEGGAHTRTLARVLDAGVSESAVVIATDGGWFERSGERVDLARHAAASRILCALADTAGSDRRLSTDDLFKAGWPGQKVVAGAGRNRVYVALNRLRKFGLSGLIVRHDGGYRLDPEVTIRRG